MSGILILVRASCPLTLIAGDGHDFRIPWMHLHRWLSPPSSTAVQKDVSSLQVQLPADTWEAVLGRSPSVTLSTFPPSNVQPHICLRSCLLTCHDDHSSRQQVQLPTDPWEAVLGRSPSVRPSANLTPCKLSLAGMPDEGPGNPDPGGWGLRDGLSSLL